MDKNFSKEFLICPCCSSPDRFFELLAKELKDRGIASPNWNFAYDVRQGVVVDPTKINAIPIGAEMPAYEIETDICMKCGCIYATNLKRHNAKRSIDQPKPSPVQVPPNLRGFSQNNPRFS